jgi:hypothetical protein
VAAEVAVVPPDEAVFRRDVPNAASPVPAMEVRLSVVVLDVVDVVDGAAWIDEAAAPDAVGAMDGPVREVWAGRFVSFRGNELLDDCVAAGGGVAGVGASAGAMSLV